MYVIGLTGNIACGKSTIGAMLAGHGALYIDADVLARDVMRRCGEAYQPVVDAFGEDVLAEDGRIDRAALARIVFSDPKKLRRLEAIVHPAVLRLAETALQTATETVAVLDAIKLFESGMAQRCDEVWVVVCPRQQQVERLMRTRAMPVEEAEMRIDAQPPQEEKAWRASVVINNGGDLAQTRAQVDRHWRRLMRRLRGMPASAATVAAPR